MNRVIYIVGLIVVVIAILSFFGLRWEPVERRCRRARHVVFHRIPGV